MNLTNVYGHVSQQAAREVSYTLSTGGDSNPLYAYPKCDSGLRMYSASSTTYNWMAALSYTSTGAKSTTLAGKYASVTYRLQVKEYPNADYALCSFRNNTTALLRFYLTPDGHIYVGNGAQSSFTLSIGTWYTIHFYANAQDDLHELVVRSGDNQTLIGSVAATDVIAATLNVIAFFCGTSDPIDYYMSGLLCEVNTTTDVAHIITTSDYRVNALNITGAGAVSDWVGSWENLSEIPTTFTYTADAIISTTTTGDHMVALENSSSAFVYQTSTIDTVKVSVELREASTTTSAARIRLISGSTTSETDTLDVSAFTSFGKLWNTDPNTSAAWTSAAIDAMEVGVGQDLASLTYALQCLNIVVEVVSTGVINKTANACADIKSEQTKTANACAYIDSYLKPSYPIADIKATVTRTAEALAHIHVRYTNTANAKADILKRTARTANAKVRIKAAITRTANAKASIKISNSGSANACTFIVNTLSSTANACTYIIGTYQQTASAVSVILLIMSQTANAIAVITPSIRSHVNAIASILVPRTVTAHAKALISSATLGTAEPIARIRRTDIDNQIAYIAGGVISTDFVSGYVNSVAEVTSSTLAYLTGSIDTTIVSTSSHIENITSDEVGSGALSISASNILVPTMSGSISLVGQEGKWKGAVSYNQGVQLAEELTQVCENSSFEVNTTWWSETKSGITGATSRSTEHSVWGIASAKIEVTDSSGVDDYIYLAPASNITTTDGQSITCSAWIKVDVLVNAYVSIEISGYGESERILTVGEWTRHVVSTNVGTSFSVRLKITSTGAGAKVIVYFDGVQIENSSYVTPYCDGSLDGSAWAGAVHLSKSSRNNAQLSYSIEGMSNTFTYITRFRTPPSISSLRSYSYTIMQLAQDEYNFNRLDFSLSTEGKLVLDMWDMWGVTKTTCTGSDTLLPGKEYVTAFILNDSADSISVSIYYALATAGVITRTYINTTPLNRNFTSGLIYIGTNKYIPAATFNGIINDWWLIPNEVLDSSQLIQVLLMGPGPYTNAKYGSNYPGTYFAEEGKFICFNYSPYILAAEGFTSSTVEVTQFDKPSNDTIRFGIEANNAEDLVSKIALLQDMLSSVSINSSIGMTTQTPRPILRYISLVSKLSLRYNIVNAALSAPSIFSRRSSLSGTICNVALSLVKEAMGMNMSVESSDSRVYTNYSTSVVTSPIVLTNSSKVRTQAKLIVKNSGSSTYADVYYGISPITTTPLNFLYNFNGTAKTSSLNGVTTASMTNTAFSTLTSFGVSFDFTTTRYKIYAKLMSNSTVDRYTIRLMGGSNAYTRESAKLLETNWIAPVSNTLKMVQLGFIDWPPKALTSLQPSGTSTTTFYLGAQTSSGTSNLSIDYLLFFPAATSSGYIGAVVETNDKLYLDASYGEVFVIDSRTNKVKTTNVTKFEGSCPILVPGDNRVCIWVADSTEQDYNLTYEWSISHQLLYYIPVAET